MIRIRISQMGALFLAEQFTLSKELQNQIDKAPIKADVWQLECEEKEYMSLIDAISERAETAQSQATFQFLLEEMKEMLDTD